MQVERETRRIVSCNEEDDDECIAMPSRPERY